MYFINVVDINYFVYQKLMLINVLEVLHRSSTSTGVSTATIWYRHQPTGNSIGIIIRHYLKPVPVLAFILHTGTGMELELAQPPSGTGTNQFIFN
jgi:hypothetical protein